jgi:type II restriction enzyme
MYCPSCSSNNLDSLPHGTKVIDFKCGSCEEQYQIKSASTPIRNRIMDSEYHTMMNAIQNNLSPNLMLLHYSKETWKVQDLLLIPRHLIVPSVIEKRNPLGPGARRAGWIGCNILLTNIPSTGRIFAIEDSMVNRPDMVREEWAELRFIGAMESKSRGWLVDVLRCVQSLDRKRFTLQEVYAQSEDELSRLHPENKNIRPKIRQQLQVLRDKGRIKFVGKGIYEQNIPVIAPKFSSIPSFRKRQQSM